MAKLTSFGFRIAALIFSILHAAALPFAWTWAPGLRGPSLNGRVTVTAHSGCMRQPENTVRSMEAGVAAGADIVEFDLNFDANGVIAQRSRGQRMYSACRRLRVSGDAPLRQGERGRKKRGIY